MITSPTGYPPGRRMAVIGTTGTGKTVLAKRLARKYDLVHVELDSLFWQPNWTPIDIHEFRLRVADAVKTDRWVSDGNYGRVRDIVWEQADIILWLDYPLFLIFWRLFRRNVKRIISREVLWGTNRDTIKGAFFSRDTLFSWAVQTHGRRRREYPESFQKNEYHHLRVFRLTSPKMTDDWLRRVSPALLAVE